MRISRCVAGRICAGALFATNLSSAGIVEEAEMFVSDLGTQGVFSGSVLAWNGHGDYLEVSEGLAISEFRLPVNPQTRFMLGSLTKAFTAAAVLRLLEAEQTSVDTPLNQWLPDLPAEWGVATVRQVLQHEAGIPSPDGREDFPRGIDEPHEIGEVINSLRSKPMTHRPGTGWHYSNGGYYLLGQLLERATDKDIASILSSHVFSPASMPDSGIYRPREVVPNLARGYSRNGGVHARQWVVARPYELSLSHAAGAAYATARDLAAWDASLRLSDGTDGTTSKLMFEPNAYGYGMGWYIDDWNGLRVAYHGGGDPGVASFFVRALDRPVVVIVLSNLDTAPVRQMAEHLFSLFASPSAPRGSDGITARGSRTSSR